MFSAPSGDYPHSAPRRARKTRLLKQRLGENHLQRASGILGHPVRRPETAPSSSPGVQMQSHASVIGYLGEEGGTSSTLAAFRVHQQTRRSCAIDLTCRNGKSMGKKNRGVRVATTLEPFLN